MILAIDPYAAPALLLGALVALAIWRALNVI